MRAAIKQETLDSASRGSILSDLNGAVHTLGCVKSDGVGRCSDVRMLGSVQRGQGTGQGQGKRGVYKVILYDMLLLCHLALYTV